MRFVIEQRPITDDSGNPAGAPLPPTFQNVDADDADAALRLFIRNDGGEIIGDVSRFPGFQAVATVRKTGRVYTLQVSPTTQPNAR